MSSKVAPFIAFPFTVLSFLILTFLINEATQTSNQTNWNFHYHIPSKFYVRQVHHYHKGNAWTGESSGKVKRSTFMSPSKPLHSTFSISNLKPTSNQLWERSLYSTSPSFVVGLYGNPYLRRTTPLGLMDERRTNDSPTVPVESLSFFQTLVPKLASTNVREKLADVSSHWANTAQAVVTSKYGQVLGLTKESHGAEIHSLHRASVAQLIIDALAKAERLYHSSIASHKDLDVGALNAQHGLNLVSVALAQIQRILWVREKWADEKKAVAFKISVQLLPKVLQELRESSRFAQEAYAIVVEMK